ncbi:hypothetical protein HOV56_gp46 [Nitrosopumilus spindle-shaped virus]|uniref:Uncharacterized protein n=1 Tax=Nitrosopumilus spindle-shaped virus TaxID=2508184 RepID=A0A514K2S0_9VIRU|nr:hypothetical protein HOV56_gp46 [Nitrosopumilus spindle-shaped virus]YP_010772875.1 hypothetical protein QIT54_gp45 [Nitrosopumilus spindle-shaped virus]QDI73935.1 hypothetical protein [Nitrosopumilus spindle-shaped virus]QDI73983.1 hypothetical protein [Nitrosopumilus spindle-shaped virus]
MSTVEMIKTNEVHTALEKLNAKFSRIENSEIEQSKKVNELKEKLDLEKTALKNIQKEKKEIEKSISNHKITFESFRNVCVECGFVESITKDIEPTPSSEAPTKNPSPI